MTVKDLKNNLNSVDSSFKIFLCKDNYFLAKQYVEKISTGKNLNINYINSLLDLQGSASALLAEYSPELNVLIVDELDEFLNINLNNCIVLCKKINKSIIDLVNNYIIEFPILQEWQIKDYMKVACPGIDGDDIDWLYNVCNGNIYKIENELSKINIFEKSKRKSVLSALKNRQDTDLYYFDNFYISNALKSNNKLNTLLFLSLDKCKSISPLGLIGLLITEYRKILFIKYSNKQLDCISGTTDKQKYFILNNYKNLTEYKLQALIDFLLDTEYSIKTGLLEASDSVICEYIICNILRINDKI